MVWIYGGGFSVGDSNANFYGPDYLIEEGVVVVTFNYRLGMLGFLSTGDKAAPGNYGLKDQVAVLKWVQKNIEKFGGDPKCVTIFGQSAGAASVQYLVQAPVTKGLFHRAIAQSGSTLCPWALQRDPARIAFEIGLSSGIVTRDTKELIDKLRQTDLTRIKLTQLGAAIFENALDSLNGIPFSPSYEPEHEGAVVTRRSYHLLQQGRFNRVPFMTGLNSQESVMFLQRKLSKIFKKKTSKMSSSVGLGKTSSGSVGSGSSSSGAQRHEHGDSTGTDSGCTPDQAALLREQAGGHIEQRGAPGGERAFTLPHDPTVYSVPQYISDSQFARPIRESAILSSQYVPVYFYLFSYEGFLGASGNSENGRADRRTIGEGVSNEIKRSKRFLVAKGSPTPRRCGTCGGKRT